MPALECLLVFIALMFSVLVYRWLVHSPAFVRLVGGVLETPAETGREVIEQLDAAQGAAGRLVEAADQAAAETKEFVAAVRKRTRRSPNS
jgi:hypothetical protein